MWGLFFLGFFLAIVFVYAPGFFLLLSTNKSLSQCIGYAPCITLTSYSLLAVLYEKLNVYSTWAIYFFPLLALGLVILAIKAIYSKHTQRMAKSHPHRSRLFKGDLPLMALCVLIGLLLMGYIFVKCLDGPESYAQVYDNYYHLGMPKSFVSTGNWSPLHPSLYTNQDGFPAPIPSSFYPVEYHMLGAMLMSCMPIGAPMAVNILNTFFPAVVLSAGMFCLVRQLFASSRAMAIFCTLASFAFAMFPYTAFYAGPLFPLAASICMIPMVASTFIAFTESIKRAKVNFSYLFAFVMGIPALALCHPSSIFALAIFLVPYCLQYLWTLKFRDKRVGLGARIILIVLLSLLAIGIWCFFYNAPFMQSALAVVKSGDYGVAESILSAVTYSFGRVQIQPFIAITTLVGAIYLLLQKQNRWLIVPVLFVGVLFVVARTLDAEDPIKHFLTGFWYTDRIRLAFLYVLFSIPICGYGLKAYYDLLMRLSQRMHLRLKQPQQQLASCSLVTAVFILVVFAPFPAPSDKAISEVRGTLVDAYAQQGEKTYDAEEASFISKVNAIVQSSDSPGAIINIPHDGSLYAYSVNESNIYFRQWTSLGQTDPSLIRLQLNEIASNEEVRKAAQRANARYVLQLDEGHYEEGDGFAAFYSPEKWIGISSIDENTPGFELILEDGDMRLFKIDEALLSE